MLQETRIISLIPSGTEILAALNLSDRIVGRSHECDYPPEITNLPVCTQPRLNSQASSADIHTDVNKLLQSALSIYEIKLELLQKLQPTHILTQNQCDVCAVSFEEVEQAVSKITTSSPQIISLQPLVLKDIWQDIENIAGIFQVDTVKLLENLESRVKIVSARTKGLSQSEVLPAIACIEWTDPLMMAGNWVPELVQIAGGKPLLSKIGNQSQICKWQDLLAANPDIIIFMPCGFELERTRKEAEVFIENLATKSEWENLHAVQNHRVYITDGNAFFNRSGPRIVDSLEILAEIIHPEIFTYDYQHRGWDYL